MLSLFRSCVVEFWSTIRLCFYRTRLQDDSLETFHMNTLSDSVLATSRCPESYVDLTHALNTQQIVSKEDITMLNQETKYTPSDVIPSTIKEQRHLVDVADFGTAANMSVPQSCRGSQRGYHHRPSGVTRVPAAPPIRQAQSISGSKPRRSPNLPRERLRPLRPLPPLLELPTELEVYDERPVDIYFLFIVHKAFLFVDRLPDFPFHGHTSVETVMGRSLLRIRGSAGRQGVYQMFYVSEEGLMVSTLRGKVGLIAVDERLLGPVPRQPTVSTGQTQILFTRVPVDRQFFATLCFTGIFLPDSCTTFHLPYPHVVIDSYA